MDAIPVRQGRQAADKLRVEMTRVNEPNDGEYAGPLLLPTRKAGPEQ